MSVDCCMASFASRNGQASSCLGRGVVARGPARGFCVSRRAAQARARAEGRDLRLRSAYKTLLHEVLEQGLLDDAPRATIHYPVVEGCPEDRFRLECYPLHALASHCEIAFAPRPHEGGGLPAYEIETPEARHVVPVPVRWDAMTAGQQPRSMPRPRKSSFTVPRNARTPGKK